MLLLVSAFAFIVGAALSLLGLAQFAVDAQRELTMAGFNTTLDSILIAAGVMLMQFAFLSDHIRRNLRLR